MKHIPIGQSQVPDQHELITIVTIHLLGFQPEAKQADIQPPVTSQRVTA